MKYYNKILFVLLFLTLTPTISVNAEEKISSQPQPTIERMDEKVKSLEEFKEDFKGLKIDSRLAVLETSIKFHMLLFSIISAVIGAILSGAIQWFLSQYFGKTKKIRR